MRAESWKGDMPWQIGLTPVAAAIEETADAPECKAECHARSDQVGHGEKGKTVLQDEDCEANRRTNESAVNDETAFGNVDDLQQRIARASAGEALIPIFGNVEQSSANYAANY